MKYLTQHVVIVNYVVLNYRWLTEEGGAVPAKMEIVELPRWEMAAYWFLSFASHLYSFYQLHRFSKGMVIRLRLMGRMYWAVREHHGFTAQVVAVD